MNRKWWKEAVIYQVYPRSFKDSNGDGIGDLRGIIQKLDYIKWLGVDLIWLNPVYQSPNNDNGYDISDYYSIMEVFGSMGDFEELLNECHKRGLRLIMDLVINHTSDEHQWFIESCSSRDNPRRDFYIWCKPRAGKEPNNWLSRFSGPAWEYDERTGEYYLHLFSRKQPDLNWRNPEVKKETFEMMKWWLDKGIDGFRMDVINFIGKTEGLPDSRNPDSPEHFVNHPLTHKLLREMREEVLSNYDIMTVGETPHVTPESGKLYVKEERRELDMIFQFEHIELGSMEGESFLEFKRIQRNWYGIIEEGGWNSQYLENHDKPRAVSVFGNDREYYYESARMLASMLLTLPGTPYIYQGQEIGMTNVEFSSIEDYDDISTINKYREELARGRDPETVLKELQPVSRDNVRTPMQWSADKNAGFSTRAPWLKVNPNYREINVEKQRNAPDSILHYYRKLLALRKKHPALIYGSYCPLSDDDYQLYVYTREYEGERILVVLNNSIEEESFEFADSLSGERELLTASYPVDENKEYNMKSVELRPYEARIYRLG